MSFAEFASQISADVVGLLLGFVFMKAVGRCFGYKLRVMVWEKL
jgi:hypothetical protein